MTDELKPDEIKTFTQDEVNAIVRTRLAEDRKKGGEHLDKREKEIMRRELKLAAKEAFTENSIPAELLEVVNITDEESIAKSVDIIKKTFDNALDPMLKEVLKGKTPKTGAGSTNTDEIKEAMGLK